MEPVIPFDWLRLLIGDAPPLFLLEITLRVLAIFLWTTTMLRWIGGRSISQLSLVEFLLVIALGSAVGDGMLYPDVPLLHAFLVVFLVIAMDKLIDCGIHTWHGFKTVVDGTPVQLVERGRILTTALKAARIAPSEAHEMLRLKGIRNLGQVETAWMETSGAVSVFCAEPPVPGLPLVPPPVLREAKPLPPDARACCADCGFLTDARAPCPHCGCTDRLAAALPPSRASSLSEEVRQDR